MTPLHALRIGAASLALLAAACGETKAPETPTAEAPAATSLAGAEGSTCPDDGPRFAITQLCTGRISNYLDPQIGLTMATPDGCEWGFTEMATANPDEAIIYRALTCKGVATVLEQHAAGLGYKTSALYGDVGKDVEPVHMFVSDPANPQKVILDQLQSLPAAEKAKCEVHPAKLDVWPSDSLVLEYTAAERKKMPTDEPIAMCGKFGRDEDSATFWRIGGGYAWFFDLGQDTPDIDPGSFMVFRKGADGAWTHVD